MRERLIVPLLLVCLGGCATAQPLPHFIAAYTGAMDPAKLHLDVIRELPTAPESGWLNSVDQESAVARFQASWLGHVEYHLDPTYVAFQAAKGDGQPVGKYSWDGGVLTICMLKTIVSLGTEIRLTSDYETCMPMRKKLD